MSSEQLLTQPNKIKASLSDRLMPKAWARSMILKHLGTMQRGQLVIEENGEKTSYGDQSDNVELIAELTIVNADTYSALALNGVIGAGESYMDGYWTSPDLVKVIRFFVINMQTLDAMDGERTWLSRMGMWLLDRVNRNTIARAQKNISAHYDLGNDFFSLFLDQTMMYSSAVFADENISLFDASNAKLETICQQLKLNADDHLVEIGTGWGGMAIYAAQNYGCRVTTTTISQEQFDFATKRVKDLGLSDKVTVLMQDYRKLTGRYDKLVSIEMIEAVGRQYFSEYFSRCADLLKPDGLMLIQAITIADQRYDQATKAVDFIQRYIFPGGCLPSVNVIGHHVASNTDMMIISLSDIGRDYAITLERWREQFLEKLETVRSQGFDERFIRMWEYYLCYCEGGFRERVISTAQIVMAKPDYRAVSSKL
ncbi:cyclopropane-fatty-acyl-phospholipid synthase family protein [Pseudomonadales bacterium]|nr:cyclopropane-fatty-acyl-phospholipid synthase family protein [Pseudomonadales bacterium]